MKDTSRLLPVGSVVLLDGGEKKVMVTGFYTFPVEDSQKIYDYCGCLYPEGIVSSEKNLVFDHSQIVKVLHVGYKDDEEKAFKQKLGEVINKQ